MNAADDIRFFALIALNGSRKAELFFVTKDIPSLPMVKEPFFIGSVFSLSSIADSTRDKEKNYSNSLRMTFENSSIPTNTESWFIALDILMILSTAVAFTLAMAFLVIIVLDKPSYTIPLLLIAHSCLTEVMLAIVMFTMAVFTLHNDLKQIQYQDTYCVSRGYMSYVVTILQNFSYLLQAFYRYHTVVYPNRIFCRSWRFQAFLISLIWIFAFLCPVPFVMKNEIKYNVDNQICQMPLQLSILTIYLSFCIYVVPISLIMLIYVKLIVYVQRMNRQVTTVNKSRRLERELKMVRRIVILVISLTTLGFPYAVFMINAFFSSPPKYHFRIAFLFIDVSLVFVMCAMFQFTGSIKTFIKGKIINRANTIFPTIT
jgi:7 transmembrane receptor (rhodopsin family)